MGKANVQAPDPRLVEANVRALERQGLQADRLLGIAEYNLPIQRQQMEQAIAASKTAEERAAEQYALARPMQERLRGLQLGMVQEAQQFNVGQRAAELRGLAQADIAQATAQAFEQAGRSAGRMGLGADRMAGSIADRALQLAQMQVGAAAGTRQQALTEQRGLMDRATNALAGYPAQVTGATSAGAGYGTMGLGLANTGMGGQQAGFGAAGTMYGQTASGYNQAYGTQANAYLQGQAQEGQFWGSLLGAGATLGAAGIGKYSDRRLKTDIVRVGRDPRSGLNLYEFAYINDNSGRRYRGVMADEVEVFDKDAVTYDDLGFASVNYARLGLEMVEV